MLLGGETLALRAVVTGRGDQAARLSTLSYAEPRKLTRLPRRSAIVASPWRRCTRVAESVRREAGGRLVFGAL